MSEGNVTRNEILPLMGTVVRSGEWIMGFCPVHADGTKGHGKGGQSLGLSNAGVLKCFAGCEFKDVIVALRGRTNGPSPIPIQRDDKERLVKVYPYVGDDGAVVAEKGRFEYLDGRKAFRWRLPGEESWKGGIKIPDMPLYGLPGLLSRTEEPVYFVEGEKACEACLAAGLVAVTHAGGAGTKDFGRSLEALRGRMVMLWPDNDSAGRAHMGLVQARLSGIAASVRLVTVHVPEKGDAFDYFHAGGTVEGLEDASPTDPVLHILAEDSVRVVHPTTAGPVTLTFSDMEKGRRELDAELAISLFGQARPFIERINLLSASARAELRRSLESVYGKEHPWAGVLNTAFAMARESFLMQDRGVDVFDIPDGIGDMFLLDPLVMADGPTVFFGDGSSLKSYLVMMMAFALGRGVPFCGRSGPLAPVLYVDYEDSPANFRRRAKRVSLGLEPDLYDVPPYSAVYFWDAKGIPFKDQVEAIKRKVEKEGVGLLVVDSAGPACGGPPEDADVTLAFFRALKKIGIPSIVIAHISKGSDTLKPFGSTFWHNEARRTWYVHRVQEEDSDELDIGLYCRKVNDLQRPSPFAYHVSFDGRDGPVTLREESMAATPELHDLTSGRNRVFAVLRSSMTVKEIADDTGMTDKEVEGILRRGYKLFVRTGEKRGTGGRPASTWGRKVREEDFSAHV